MSELQELPPMPDAIKQYINDGKGRYVSTKTYTHAQGLSACFRQWRAESHCRFLHGYALQVRVLFETSELDERNWVVDFGSLKSFKAWLEDTFDHKLLVALDDPHYHELLKLQDLGLCQVRPVIATGCEAFSRMIYEYLDTWLKDNGYKPRCRVAFVEVREHEANSAMYFPDRPSTGAEIMHMIIDKALDESELAKALKAEAENPAPLTKAPE